MDEHFFELFKTSVPKTDGENGYSDVVRYGASGLDLEPVMASLVVLLPSLGITVQALPIQAAASHIEQRVRGYFKQVIPGNHNQSSTSLELATSLFRSTISFSRKSFGIPYKESLRFRQFFPSVDYPNSRNSARLNPLDVLSDANKFFEFDELSSAVTTQIVTACGMDPKSCTHAMLEDLDPYVVCVACTQRDGFNGNRLTMPWTQAVRVQPLILNT